MTPAEIIQAVEGLEPAMQRAYLDQIRAVVGAATIAEVERLIATDDEDGLVALMSLGALSAFLELARSAFLSGAKFEIKAIAIPRQVGRFEFDARDPVAESWVSTKAQEIRQAAEIDVRAAIREVLSSRRRVVVRPQAAGASEVLGEIGATPMVKTPRQAALDLLGRTSAQTGARSGGVIGLPGNYAQYVLNARQQLLSGDPDEMRKYLQRKRRDGRFDSIVKRAIEAEKPVAKADVDKIAGRYADRLMKTYAEMLSKAEALEAFGAGRDQVYEQLIAKGLDRGSVTKTWRDRGDKKVRHSHTVMNGQEVQKDEPFQSPDGALLRYPGDASLGAGWKERAHCRCSAIYRIRLK